MDANPEFPPVTPDAWKDRIIKDLKGTSFDSLVWHNDNGFDVQPFYTAQDVTHAADPCFAHTAWTRSVKPVFLNAKETNTRLLELLNTGADGISVDVSNGALHDQLHGVDLGLIGATIILGESDVDSLPRLLQTNTSRPDAGLTLGPANTQDSASLKKWQKALHSLKGSQIRMLAADALGWAQAGAPEYYELALSFAQIMAWPEDSLSNVAIRTAVSSDLFMQMAKLRAYRRLWDLLAPELSLNRELHVIAETTLSDFAPTDTHNNLMRSAIASFAAVAGGCNELAVHPHDVLAGNSSEATRLALNQQLILKEECFMDQVADVSAGSYYIECLTDQLAEKALHTLKNIQKQGGFYQVWDSGEPSRVISAHARITRERVENDKQVIVGVNKFSSQSKQPEMKDVLDLLERSGINNPAALYALQKTSKHEQGS